jgi:hypothetical protein
VPSKLSVADANVKSDADKLKDIQFYRIIFIILVSEVFIKLILKKDLVHVYGTWAMQRANIFTSFLITGSFLISFLKFHSF